SDFSIEHGIYAFAKETNSDLIAMGTHAWKGFIYLLAGSIAEDLVNHVDFPIWTFGLSNVAVPAA
ncbi:MAG TPA: universal stress protein, partial [Cyclobacteriaceae bacterium]|nr:universal stress protein [Cyclobacteriaceae bacterium]